MMGPVTLSEVKKELRRAFKKNEAEMQAFVDEEMAKARARNSRAPTLEKELTWICKILCEAKKEKKPKTGTAKKRQGKKAATV